MYKISIITPVYNVEGYLKKNLDSICNQSFKDFELIIVDDGSKDSSGNIADEYEIKDERIKVVHKKNGGAPSARNEGIDLAQGKYLYFPDSDDWLEPNYIAELYELAEKSSAQMIISGFIMEYYEKNEFRSYIVSEQEQIYINKDEIRNNIHRYLDNMMVAVPWNKLYLTEYIKENNLYFPNVKWDDLHFNLECLKNIEKVAISSSYGYHFFRSRPGSETTLVFDEQLYEKRKEQFEHILAVYKSWNIKDKTISEKLYGYYLGRLVQCILEVSTSNRSFPEIKEKVKLILNDPLTITAFEKGKVNSKYLRLLSNIMKTKNIHLNIGVGKALGFIKNNFSSTFYLIKSKSVNNAKIDKEVK